MKKIIILMLLMGICLAMPVSASKHKKNKAYASRAVASKPQQVKKLKNKSEISEIDAFNDKDAVILVLPQESINISPAKTEINSEVPKLFKIKPQNVIYVPNFSKINNDNKDDSTFKLSIEEGDQKDENVGILRKTGRFLKGTKGDDCINFLMFSKHTMRDRKDLNETNKLFSIDYNGYSFGTFNNSYHTQSYYVGITRKLLEKELGKNCKVDFKYKLMILRGYKYEEPDLAGFTPNIVPVIGFSKGLFGIDFLMSPGKTATFAMTFRVNLDELTKKVTQ